VDLTFAAGPAAAQKCGCQFRNRGSWIRRWFSAGILRGNARQSGRKCL